MQTLTVFLILALVTVFALSLVPEREPRFPTALVSAVMGTGVLLSLALASPGFGNRLAETNGYWPVAASILLTYAVTIATPFLLAATAAYLARRAEKGRLVVLGAGLGTAVVSWVVGIYVMLATIWS